ncbi:DNA polymerase, partial [Paramuricea clavata]
MKDLGKILTRISDNLGKILASMARLNNLGKILAEKFGNSFVLESKLSEDVKKGISQEVAVVALRWIVFKMANSACIFKRNIRYPFLANCSILPGTDYTVQFNRRVLHRIGKYLVDGFNVETNTVWEVQGCLWHGCERCYARDTVNPINLMTMQDLKQRTLAKIQFLKDNRYNVVEIWTYDIERQLATEPEMNDFFDNFEISEPLEPRHAFFGGRTNAARLYYDIQPEEKIRYVDFCSLYPWCNKYGEYPIGHPEIITENFQSISEYFGLVKCSVLPPRALYHPVLPYRTQGKLMFPLCRTCADNLQQEPCHHSDAERTLHGTRVQWKPKLYDSVIYVSKEGEWEPPTGSCLGELTDELDGAHITTFVSGGPKNYAYETSTDKT